MKTFAFLGMAALLAVPACAQTTGPRDTGNMAYPAPVPNTGTNTAVPSIASPSGNSTGSAQFPAPLPQGNLSTTRTTGVGAPLDTGNMAYPAPLPQGNVGMTAPKK